MASTRKAAPQTLDIEAAYDPAWDVAVKCQKDGKNDIQAIKEVWRSMPPPAPLRTVATIIGAIYADTYWARTKMDYTVLSASLQQAGGWNKADCDRAAQTAFANWYGLLMRDDFSNVGEIPKQGTITNSPDVLCNGAGALDPYDMLTKWGSRFFNAAPGTKNYIYGRAQSVNIPVPITKPVLRFFSTDGGFNQPPNSWTILYTFDNNTESPMAGLQAGPVLAGGRAANGVKPNDAFSFMPLGSGHYCLIGVVGTEFFTNNPPAETGNWNSMEWITYNGAAAWHNINVTNANEGVLKFYNQDGRPEQFAFEAHCVNLPAGTEVSLESDDARLIRPIDSGSVNITRDYQVVGIEGEVPANFGGDLTVRFVTPDRKPLPTTAMVEVRMLWLLSQDHPHYIQAVDHLGVRNLGQPVKLQLGSFTFLGSKE